LHLNFGRSPWQPSVVRRPKPEGRRVAERVSALLVGDGQGLYLKNGTSWVFRFMLRGKVGAMGLGPLHAITLQEARIRAREARKVLLEGKDPLTHKQDSLTAIKLDAAKAMKFKQAALEFLKTSSQASRTMDIDSGTLRLPGHRRLAIAND
ncbi:MAG: Arm DNA-binding domain-containing protein, partial [Methyloceanibacter sp.]